MDPIIFRLVYDRRSWRARWAWR